MEAQGHLRLSPSHPSQPLAHPSSVGIPWPASWHAPWHHLPANNRLQSPPPAGTDGFGYRRTHWMAASCGASAGPPPPPPQLSCLCCQGNAGNTLLAPSPSLFPAQTYDFSRFALMKSLLTSGSAAATHKHPQLDLFGHPVHSTQDKLWACYFESSAWITNCTLQLRTQSARVQQWNITPSYWCSFGIFSPASISAYGNGAQNSSQV